MYAVIESGGKQYRVELGSRIQVDHLDAQPGDSITLDRVLLVADGDATAVGQPVVDGASVSAEVLGQDRGEKIVVFKYKPKARTRVKKGFRAELTTLRISDIAFAGRSAAKDAEASESKRAKEEQAAAREAEKAAAAKATADKELAAKLAAAADEADAKPARKSTAKAAKSTTKKSPSQSAATTVDGDTAERSGATEPEAGAEVAEPEATVGSAAEPEATAETAAEPEATAETAAEPEAAASDATPDPEPPSEPDVEATDSKKDE